jgi:tRNA pseudouridine13 synthase
MRIKTKADDFYVEEVLHFAPAKKEMPFRLYLLEKEGWNTSDAIREAAVRKKVPLGEIRSLGKKDRHARTVQFLSVPEEYDLACEGEGYSVRSAGFSSKQLEPAVLKGNRFSLVLRDMEIREAERTEKRLEGITRRGFANYFDDQRFGNVGSKGEFFGEMLVKRRFDPALRKYFSFCHPEAPVYLKKRKALLAEKWGQWGEMEPLCTEPRLKKMLSILKKRGRDGVLACFRLIPPEEMGMYFSAYSSFLWNETLSRFLQGEDGELFSVELRTGQVFQYTDLPEGLLERLSGEPLPTVGPDMPPLPPDMDGVFSRLLAERGVRLSKFRLKEISQAYFASFPRQCAVLPEDMEWKREEDDLFPGKVALRLRFFLPRGSYATMLLKSAGRVQDPRT